MLSPMFKIHCWHMLACLTGVIWFYWNLLQSSVLHLDPCLFLGLLSCMKCSSLAMPVFQRKGRAGRVQPGECYHLYPRCVYEAFAEYQLPELLRTPLNSLCLQIKSLQVGSIGEFLSAALQPPESLAVSVVIEQIFRSMLTNECWPIFLLWNFIWPIFRVRMNFK